MRRLKSYIVRKNETRNYWEKEFQKSIMNTQKFKKKSYTTNKSKMRQIKLRIHCAKIYKNAILTKIQKNKGSVNKMANITVHKLGNTTHLTFKIWKKIKIRAEIMRPKLEK